MTAIRSDGGSSTYYDISIPGWLIARLDARDAVPGSSGGCYIKTEELISVMFDNDFDFGNVLKSLVRVYGAMNGSGKAGNDVPYDLNKIGYSVDKIRETDRRKAAEAAKARGEEAWRITQGVINAASIRPYEDQVYVTGYVAAGNPDDPSTWDFAKDAAPERSRQSWHL